MFKNVVPITKESHQDTKIEQLDSYAFADQLHLCSIMVHEFGRAAGIYPIVFVEDQDKEEFRPVALFGLKPGENQFVTKEGKWDGAYIPATIRRYPFTLAKTKDEKQFAVCLDEESAVVNEEEGTPLFQENGDPSDFLENVKKYLGELHQMEALTMQFSKIMKDKYMFTPLNMKFREIDEVKNISGVYIIDEQRLNNMSDEDFLSFRHQNFLQPIFYHLLSLSKLAGGLLTGQTHVEKS